MPPLSNNMSVPGSGVEDTVGAVILIGGQVRHPAGEALGSLANVLIVNGLVMSICTNTSKKLVGSPIPELSKIATENESGVSGSTFVVRLTMKLSGFVLLGVNP